MQLFSQKTSIVDGRLGSEYASKAYNQCYFKRDHLPGCFAASTASTQ